MILTHVRTNGTLVLGFEAEAAGFTPGAVVRLTVLSSGSLLVSLDDTPVILEVPYVRGAHVETLRRIARAGGDGYDGR